MSNYESVLSYLKELTIEDNVAILMHNNPDPDAIGSASALRHIIKKKYNTKSTIFYEGDVLHRENETILNVLNVNMQKFSSFGDLSKFTKVFIVDATTKNSQVKECDLIIDHHLAQDAESEHVVVEAVGSCCTVLFEMMMELDIELSPLDDKDLATLMFMGIRTDTNELLSEGTTERDWNAYQGLSKFIDKKKVLEILNYAYPSYYRDLSQLTYVEDNVFEHQGWFICGVGYISKSQLPGLTMIAEDIVRVEGYETTIIFAVCENSLEVRVRSINNSISVDRLCKKVFGEEFGGGRRGAGASSVPLGLFSPEAMNKSTKDLVWECVKQVCFHRINKLALAKYGD